jgi:hypothetical protein
LTVGVAPGYTLGRLSAPWLLWPLPHRPVPDTMSTEQASDDPPANSPWGGPSQRGLKMRKRQDQGADLFRAALQLLDDPARLRHALLELSRTYNPVTNATLLAGEVRHRVLELAGQGEADEARRLLEGALTHYIASGQPPGSAGEAQEA